MSDVILVVPPLTPDETSPLGIGIIKSMLGKNNIKSKILFCNRYYQKSMDQELYRKLYYSNIDHLLCEYIFSIHAFPNKESQVSVYSQLHKQKEYMNYNLEEEIGISDLEKLQQDASIFLEDMKNQILSENPKIVGFQSNFNQVCFSIALSKIIRKSNIDVINVLGGFNCLEPMGSNILTSAKYIDYIFSGEADFEFVKFCQNLLKSGKQPERKVYHCDPVKNMDDLPYPDFDEYFEQDEVLVSNNKMISFETSRGCWWGEKSHCIFCGINSTNMSFRKKTITRVIKELDYLVTRHNNKNFSASDSILPKEYFETLSQFSNNLDSLSFEIRPNTDYMKLLMLKKCNMKSCVPGIETLNDNLITILKKGGYSANNIRFLRDSRSLRIIPSWFFLYNIPGENEKDYIEMLDFIP